MLNLKSVPQALTSDNLDRQKASLLLCIAIRRKPPIPQPRKHEIGIHIIPPRNLTNRNPRNPRLRTEVVPPDVV